MKKSTEGSQVHHNNVDGLREFARCCNVTNDCGERRLKLSADFTGAAKTEEHFQNVIQVVEADRKERPNLRKRKQ